MGKANPFSYLLMKNELDLSTYLGTRHPRGHVLFPQNLEEVDLGLLHFQGQIE